MKRPASLAIAILLMSMVSARLIRVLPGLPASAAERETPAWPGEPAGGRPLKFCRKINRQRRFHSLPESKIVK